MSRLVERSDAVADAVTAQIETIFPPPTLGSRKPNRIIVWDTPRGCKERRAKCMCGRRGVHPMPEWLNSLLITTVPSEVRR